MMQLYTIARSNSAPSSSSLTAPRLPLLLSLLATKDPSSAQSSPEAAPVDGTPRGTSSDATPPFPASRSVSSSSPRSAKLAAAPREAPSPSAGGSSAGVSSAMLLFSTSQSSLKDDGGCCSRSRFGGSTAACCRCAANALLLELCISFARVMASSSSPTLAQA
ncbi:unnamed protein product [Ectocarpus sp. 8 AP-2014]